MQHVALAPDDENPPSHLSMGWAAGRVLHDGSRDGGVQGRVFGSLDLLDEEGEDGVGHLERERSEGCKGKPQGGSPIGGTAFGRRGARGDESLGHAGQPTPGRSHLFSQASQSIHERGGVASAREGKEDVSKKIAAVAKVSVGLVLPPGKPPNPRLSAEGRPGEGEEGTEKEKVMTLDETSGLGHGGEPQERMTSRQLPGQGFPLVISVLARQDGVQAFFPRHPRKGFIASQAGAMLQRGGPFTPVVPAEPRRAEGESRPRGDPGHPTGFAGTRGPQCVVDVEHDGTPGLARGHGASNRFQQEDRIQTSGHGDPQSGPGRFRQPCLNDLCKSRFKRHLRLVVPQRVSPSRVD